MNKKPYSPTPDERKQILQHLSNEEILFIQKANNAGHSISFTPKGENTPILFTPTKAQIINAQKSRASIKTPEHEISLIEIQKAKQEFKNVAIISPQESDLVPLNTAARSTFFQTLTPEAKKFVLKANLAGLNVTVEGSNGQTFLYMAPTDEMQKNQMRATLLSLESKETNSLSQSRITHSYQQESELRIPQQNQNS